MTLIVKGSLIGTTSMADGVASTYCWNESFDGGLHNLNTGSVLIELLVYDLDDNEDDYMGKIYGYYDSSVARTEYLSGGSDNSCLSTSLTYSISLT